MDPNALRIDLGIADTLERLRACGLSNRCIDIFRNDTSDASVQQLAQRFRRKVLARRQFERTGPQIVQFTNAWKIGELPRRQARGYLQKYLEPLVDAAAYTDFLTRLALGGAEFDISAEPIVRLDGPVAV